MQKNSVTEKVRQRERDMEKVSEIAKKKMNANKRTVQEFINSYFVQEFAGGTSYQFEGE